MAPHSSTLAWKIPWTEEPGGPQSMGSQRVMTPSPMLKLWLVQVSIGQLNTNYAISYDLGGIF